MASWKSEGFCWFPFVSYEAILSDFVRNGGQFTHGCVNPQGSAGSYSTLLLQIFIQQFYMHICGTVWVCTDENPVVTVDCDTPNSLAQGECFSCSKRTKYHERGCINRRCRYFSDYLFLVFIQVWVKNPRKLINLTKKGMLLKHIIQKVSLKIRIQHIPSFDDDNLIQTRDK